MDLYAALGIPRDASRDAIRKAYRRKARTVHPDVGGSTEAYALVRTAHDVLTDAGRRKVYDETGKIEEAPVDNEITDALQHVMSAFEHIFTVCQQRGIDPVEVDLLKDAKTFLEGRRADYKKGNETAGARLRKLEKIAKRLKAKKGKSDRLSMLFHGPIGSLNQAIVANNKQIKSIGRALEIMADHEFNFSPPDHPYQNQNDLASRIFSRSETA